MLFTILYEVSTLGATKEIEEDDDKRRNLIKSLGNIHPNKHLNHKERTGVSGRSRFYFSYFLPNVFLLVKIYTKEKKTPLRNF